MTHAFPTRRSSELGGERGRFALAMGEEPQRPRGGNGGILLAQRPGGCVARIGEDLAAGRLLPDVEGREIGLGHVDLAPHLRSEEHTSELQSLMRTSYAVFCLKKKIKKNRAT